MEPVVVMKIGGSYTAKFDSGYRSWYEVGGVRVDGRVVFDDALSFEDVWKITENERLDHYESVDGEKLSIEAYNEKLKTITGDCECEPTFETLEAEYEYKKFIQHWSSRYVKETSRERVPLRFEEYGDSKNPFIKSYRFIGKDLDKCLYQYIPDERSLAMKIAKDMGFDEVEDKTFTENTKGPKFSIPTHSGIRYMKVNGSYVIKDGFSLSKISAGTLAECEAAYKQDVAKLENIFLVQKSLIDNRDFDKQLFYNELSELEAKIKAIDCKQGSRFQYRAAMNKVAELKDKLSGVLVTA